MSAPPPRQLALSLEPRPAYGREDFLVSDSNRQAIAFIERWPVWPDGRALLIGPPGSGKTHLAAIWAGISGADTVESSKACEAILGGAARGAAFVVEDVSASPLDETGLFHLLNHAAEAGISLLLTASDIPAHWGVTLPDLMSRLRLLPSVAIAPPDETLLRAVLVKLFDDRQLVVDSALIEYLARHLDRSLACAREIVARLDEEALSRGRRVTRAMAAEVLAAGGVVDESE